MIDLDQERQMEDAQDIRIEQLLRTDWDFAIEHLGVSPDMTVSEFSKALKELQHYGWDISANELLETIKDM